ncbi:helix-turn-helix domain-containing protein [Aquabacter sp. CN5-332]|uniref:helix-turn-helix domain-containing protein n=1 Tax=Aquabacter sp. CN5-332 TaxID=3156608 RepID=UPI0032B4F3E8
MSTRTCRPLSRKMRGVPARTTRRMRKVEDMLAQQELPLTEIAAAAGFADQAHFTRTLRKLAGITPAAWRRAQRS